nr:diphosphate--fructose-6-phosphate 1-phosphotransferase [Paenibacillus piri]
MELTGSWTRYSKKIAVIQAGGPTAVLNSSLYGFLKEIVRMDRRTNVIGVHQGLSGLVNGDFFRLDMRQPLDWLKYQPGAVLGSGRMALSDTDLEIGVKQLKKADIHVVVLIGGNGTMWACSRLVSKAQEIGYGLQVIGIPKTVDNDIAGIDHTPGFPSAANFVAHAVRDLSIDLKAMKNFEQVRIIETMGRNVGWLTAASAFFKKQEEDGPHLVYVPEKPFDINEMISAVSDIQARLGYCVVVVSEGLKGESGQPIMMDGINGLKQNAGKKALGGVGSVLREAVSNELGLACRYENLGILQRCASFAVSKLDRIEAMVLGERAAQLIFQGESGCMVGIERLSEQPYSWDIRKIAFDKVAGLERELDSAYTNVTGTIDPSYRQWLSPFMSEAKSYKSLKTLSLLDMEETS